MILPMIMMVENEEERSFLTKLFEDYYGNVYETCYKILKNHHNAEEAASDVFIMIIDKVKYFREICESDLPGLIYICSRNMAINHYRKLSNRSAREISSTYYPNDEESTGGECIFVDTSVDVEQTVIDHDFLQYVKTLIKSLPDDQQVVIMLKYFYNFRNNEIADIMGITRSNIDSKVYRAKHNLQTLLSKNKTDH